MTFLLAKEDRQLNPEYKYTNKGLQLERKQRQQLTENLSVMVEESEGNERVDSSYWGVVCQIHNRSTRMRKLTGRGLGLHA